MRKTVLITGASGGLGLEFARIYAREGFDLVVVARSEGKLYKLKSELETQYDCHVWVLAQDLSQPDAAYEVFNYTLEKNITIDALVNNAGFGDFGNFWEVDAQRQTDLLQVNIMTLVQLTRYFLPGMVERRHGSVLNLSSVAAFSAGPRMCLYYQVETVTNGAISVKMMNRCMSIGVAVSVGLAMLRVLTGISIQWFVIPGYLIALVLSRFVPDIFIGIAFDSGGVASGPMTSTFLLPLSIGVCEALGGNLMTDAFGVVALVALTPLIAIQLMGLVYKLKTEKRTSTGTAEIADDCDAIVDLEEGE